MFRGDLSGKPLYDAVIEAQNLVGQPTPEGFERANSFFCPLGPAPARGWVLLRRQDLNNLNLNNLQTLNFHFEPETGATQTRTFQNLVIAKEPVNLDPGLGANDPLSIYLVEVADARWRCQNPYYSIALDKAYNVRAAAFQEGNYLSYSLNTGVAWTWAGMLEDIWNVLTPLGAWPGLPAGVTPASAPDGWEFRGVSAYDALNMILARMGCALKADLSLTVNQFSIVQVGATDAAADLVIRRARLSKIHDGEFLDITRGKVPYGCRVFFHRREKNYGVEQTTPQTNNWQGNAVYHVDVAGPVTTNAEPNTYHPLWSDLPAIYDDSGTITNAAACSTSATELTNNFYRMLRTTGGLRLWQRYSGLLALTAGSDLKGVSWHVNGDGIYTEIIRHPFLFLEATSQGWREVFEDASKLHSPDFRPTWPVYPHLFQIVKLTVSTADGNGLYACTVEQSQPDTLSWADRENAYALNLRGTPTLKNGGKYHGRLIGYYGGRSLYAVDDIGPDPTFDSITLSGGTSYSGTLVRITGHQALAANKLAHYSYVLLDAQTVSADGIPEFLDRQGTWSSGPAYETSNNYQVPIDGSAIVELLTDAQGNKCFAYPCEPEYFGKRTAENTSGGTYTITDVYRSTTPNWANVPDGLKIGPLTARALSGQAGLPCGPAAPLKDDDNSAWNYTVRLIRGTDCSGYAHAEIVPITPAGGGWSAQWTVTLVNVFGGNLTLKFTSNTGDAETITFPSTADGTEIDALLPGGYGASGPVGGPWTLDAGFSGDGKTWTLVADSSGLANDQKWYFYAEQDTQHVRLKSTVLGSGGYPGVLQRRNADGTWTDFSGAGLQTVWVDLQGQTPDTNTRWLARTYGDDGAGTPVYVVSMGSSTTWYDVTINYLTIVNTIDINNITIIGTPIWQDTFPADVVSKVCTFRETMTGTSTTGSGSWSQVGDTKTAVLGGAVTVCFRGYIQASNGGGAAPAAGDRYDLTVEIDGAKQTDYASAGFGTGQILDSGSWEWIVALAAGTHTIKMFIQRSAGGGTAQCKCEVAIDAVLAEKTHFEFPPGTTSYVLPTGCATDNSCCYTLTSACCPGINIPNALKFRAYMDGTTGYTDHGQETATYGSKPASFPSFPLAANWDNQAGYWGKYPWGAPGDNGVLYLLIWCDGANWIASWTIYFGDNSAFTGTTPATTPIPLGSGPSGGAAMAGTFCQDWTGEQDSDYTHFEADQAQDLPAGYNTGGALPPNTYLLHVKIEGAA